MAQAHATTNHDVIRRWIESRDGHPAVVRATHTDEQGSSGLLRVDFGKPEKSLEPIEWQDFFDTFDAQQLAFLYQEDTASGAKSRFHKFVALDSVDSERH